MTQDNTMAHITVTVCRAVELGITAEDLASADDDFEDRSPRRPLAVAESDTEVARAQVNYQNFAACIRHCLCCTQNGWVIHMNWVFSCD